MKETYFTLDNIDKISNEWLKSLWKFQRKNKINFIPENSALLILDMQKYFLEKESHAYIPSSEAIIHNIKRLMNAFLEKKLPIILTRHIDVETEDNPMKRWWKGIIKESDPMSEIIPELTHPKTIIIKKPHYDTFYKTDLEKILKEKKVNQIIIMGVMTHLCCERFSLSSNDNNNNNTPTHVKIVIPFFITISFYVRLVVCKVDTCDVIYVRYGPY